MRSSSACLLLSTAVVLACQADPGPQRLTATDSSAIVQVQSSYVSAWLADDTAGVLATLDSGAVLIPPGRLPVTGHSAIRAFWWPDDGTHTTITDFAWTLDELRGRRDLAFTRGISRVGWNYEKDTVRSQQTVRSVNLTILTRSDDGKWRILRQMWGSPLPN
jgi:ketosteroid isomerase-like protein